MKDHETCLVQPAAILGEDMRAPPFVAALLTVLVVQCWMNSLTRVAKLFKILHMKYLKIHTLNKGQQIENIGRILKILVDEFPAMQVIATGSSSFGLGNQTAEPLTGRMARFELYPLSLAELAGDQGYSAVEPRLDFLLRFGSYPSIIGLSEAEARVALDELVSNYLYRDALAFVGMRKSTVLIKLLELLARQIGQEVSYQELGQALGIDRRTVVSYIDLLEQCFILFRLGAFSRNLRKEVAKSVKIYFYDLGVRNGIIQNFAPLSLRNDVGALWENFCIVERLKLLAYRQRFVNQYFWRTYDQKEIDYLEEADGILAGYEFKWNPTAKVKEPTDFLQPIPVASSSASTAATIGASCCDQGHCQPRPILCH